MFMAVLGHLRVTAVAIGPKQLKPRFKLQGLKPGSLSLKMVWDRAQLRIRNRTVCTNTVLCYIWVS